MPPNIVQVFVSSTWLDLQPERKEVEAALQRMRETKFVGMEYFGSRNETTQRASLGEVDRSQAFIGILAGRYGSGITEDEYRRARELGLPCFIYSKRESVISPECRETEPNRIAQLRDLKDELRREHTVSDFSTPEELAASVSSDIHRWLFDEYLTPRLTQAAQEGLPGDQGQRLLEGIRDLSALSQSLLKRGDSRDIVERVMALAAQVSSSWQDASVARAREQYLKYVINANSHIDPRGMLQAVRSVSVSLSEVFVSLYATGRISGGWATNENIERLQSPSGPEGDSEVESKGQDFMSGETSSTYRPIGKESEDHALDAPGLVQEHSQIVILGEPGAGKTTLMRFLASRFAHTMLVPGNRSSPTATEQLSQGLIRDKNGDQRVELEKGDVECDEHRLPILVRLASYADAFAKDHNLTLSEFLPKAFGDVSATRDALAALFSDALDKGCALVLLDGIDEIVDESERTLISKQIDSFVAGVKPSNRFIVTSRVAAYRFVPQSGFKHFKLLALGREQIETFLDRWCVAVERYLAPQESESETQRLANSEARTIKAQLLNNKSLARLASNPLMLTVIALIHRNRKQELPSRRVELYAAATKTLLEYWPRSRGIPTRNIVRETEAVRLLGPLAFWMNENKPVGLATSQEVIKQLKRAHAAASGLRTDDQRVEDHVEDFLRRIVLHSGILLERENERYGFIHPTFQDYFAARELLRRRPKSAKRIYRHRHHAKWHESIMLAIAYESLYDPEHATHLIRSAILAQGEYARKHGFVPSEDETEALRDLLLAAGSIGDSAQVDADLRREVVEQLVRSYLRADAPHGLPLRREMEDMLLYLRERGVGGEAVDSLVAALTRHSPLTRGSAARALRTLNFGTPKAVEGLLKALNDENSDVRVLVRDALTYLAPRTVGGVKLLLNALRNGNAYVRSFAASELGELQEALPEAVAGLLHAQQTDSNPHVRSSACLALGTLRTPTAEIVGSLVDRLRDPNATVRASAALGLGNLCRTGEPAYEQISIRQVIDDINGLKDDTGWVGLIGGRLYSHVWEAARDALSMCSS
jgi:hypothetical protein